jgi:hypothetical protein
VIGWLREVRSVSKILLIIFLGISIMGIVDYTWFYWKCVRPKLKGGESCE